MVQLLKARSANDHISLLIIASTIGEYTYPHHVLENEHLCNVDAFHKIQERIMR